MEDTAHHEVRDGILCWLLNFYAPNLPIYIVCVVTGAGTTNIFALPILGSTNRVQWRETKAWGREKDLILPVDSWSDFCGLPVPVSGTPTRLLPRTVAACPAPAPWWTAPFSTAHGASFTSAHLRRPALALPPQRSGHRPLGSFFKFLIC